MDVIGRINFLKDEINRCNQLYYLEQSSPLSDAEYDQMFKELTQLEEEHPLLITPDSPTQRVGSVGTKFKPHKHKYRLYSLDNSNTYQELIKWYERIQKEVGDVELVCELKIDGLAVALTYKKGLLVTGATRGDGFIGEDITRNIKTIKTIPLKLHANEEFQFKNIEIRGEIYMPNSSFNKLNEENFRKGLKPFANPRNAASGSIRQLDSKITKDRDLSMFCYGAIFEDADKTPKTHFKNLQTLRKLGFNTNPNIELCKNIDEVIKYVEHWKEKRFELDYATDGMVIKVNNLQQQEELGFTSRAPKWATAFKFPPEEAHTELLGVETNVGKSGAVTPIAILFPVQLAGSTVSRASLHNFDEIERLDVRISDTVIIKKAAEIIPKVIKVDERYRKPESKKISAPTECPSCYSQLETREGEVNLFCPNTLFCPAQIKARLEYWVSKEAMDIDFIGPAKVEQLYNKKLATNPADLYTLSQQDFMCLDNVKAKSAYNLFKSIQESKNRPLQKFLNALSIRHVGKETASILAEHFSTLENIKNASEEELSKVDGVGEKIAKGIYAFFNDENTKIFLQKLEQAGVIPQEQVITSKSDAFKGQSFVLTGTLQNMKRDEAAEKIKMHGGKVVSAVSKNTSYVVAGESAGSKLTKAQNFGVIILSEDEFLKMIEAK